MAKPKKSDVINEEDIAEKDVKVEVETTEERAARKALAPKGPVPKKKAQLIAPDFHGLYPWAVNRGKVKRAHEVVQANLIGRNAKLSKEEIDQLVMDEYTSHNGLVRGYEKDTTVGRRKAIRPESAPEAGDGSTTDEVVNGVDEDGDE